MEEEEHRTEQQNPRGNGEEGMKRDRPRVPIGKREKHLLS